MLIDARGNTIEPSPCVYEMRYGNGTYIRYEYDDMYRTTKKIYNGDNSKRVEYYYNVSGNLGVVVDYITNETTRYIYDLYSRLVEVEVFGTASVSATDLLKSIKYTYADKTNYLTEVEYDSPLGTQSYSYNYGDMANGEMPDAVYSVDYNGTTQLEYTYDKFGRLTERNLAPINKSQTFTYKQGGYGENSTSTLVETVTVNGVTTSYEYDSNGNITRINSNGNNQFYSYNSNNELISYFDDSSGAFDTYDYTYQNGNILSVYYCDELEKTFSYTDPNWPDKLTAFNGRPITYDAIGNPLTYHDGKVFAWQNGRQLATVTKGTNIYSYTYNGDGIRTSKTVNGTTTEFIYVDGVLLGQKTGNNTLMFLYDESGNKFGFIYNGAYYYYDINLQGDVVGIYNSNGEKVVAYNYDPWGHFYSFTDTSGINIGTINPIRYRGYYYDNETGFYYLQSRYYDPNICRFINADELVSTGQGVLGFNMFAYCNNNPVNMLDPTGHNPILRRGSWGDWVSTLQNLLNKNGANLEVDGKFGPLTQKAVINYQLANKLTVDGICGPQTWGSLLKAKENVISKNVLYRCVNASNTYDFEIFLVVESVNGKWNRIINSYAKVSSKSIMIDYILVNNNISARFNNDKSQIVVNGKLSTRAVYSLPILPDFWGLPGRKGPTHNISVYFNQ